MATHTGREEVRQVRIVGYIREALDPSEGPTAFAQSEQLRRYADRYGHSMVALCRDARTPGHPLGREGYRSLLAVIAAGATDAVLVATLDVLSSDQIVQEILLWDLRSRRVSVLSADPADEDVLGESPGPTRMLIRDVLARVAEHGAAMRDDAEEAPREGASDVVVQIDRESSVAGA